MLFALFSSIFANKYGLTMNIQIKRSILFFFFALFFAGCRENEPKEFSYTFVLESTQTYKLLFSLNSRKEYTVKKQNFRFEQEQPFHKTGVLTDEEYARFKSLLFKSKLFDMNDSYGFEKEPEYHIADMIFQIAYKADGREKFISIRDNRTMTLPEEFLRLLKYTNEFISAHVKE